MTTWVRRLEILSVCWTKLVTLFVCLVVVIINIPIIIVVMLKHFSSFFFFHDALSHGMCVCVCVLYYFSFHRHQFWSLCSVFYDKSSFNRLNYECIKDAFNIIRPENLLRHFFRHLLLSLIHFINWCDKQIMFTECHNHSDETFFCDGYEWLWVSLCLRYEIRMFRVPRDKDRFISYFL